MSVRAASCAVVAVSGLIVAGALAAVSEADSVEALVVAGALVVALAVGLAVELRVPGLVGEGRRHASTAGFVWVVVVYGLAVGAYCWVHLDSDDFGASGTGLPLVLEFSSALDYLGIAAVCLTVATGFAIGRWRAVPVLTALAFAVGMALAANQGPCAGWCFFTDRDVVGLTAVMFVPPLTCLGVGGRGLAERRGVPASGRILSGLVALVVALVAASVRAPGFVG